jgi:pimeloyl-ACP methyl ester carboxylesterase
MVVKHVRSADGTSIAYEAVGHGPPLVLVGGGFCDRHAPSSGTPLAEHLAHRFTAVSYDRRGRGDSTITPPCDRAREVEDLAALVEVLGGTAWVFGNSSGGLLAVDAAAQGLSIPKLAVYEPPVILDVDRAASFEALATELDQAVAEGRRSDAVEKYFTRVMQMPAPAVAHMRASAAWPDLAAIAHTLGNDLRITSEGPRRLEVAAQVKATTLVLSGGASPAWMTAAVQTLARSIPQARHQTLEGQTHAAEPRALAQALEAFLAG